VTSADDGRHAVEPLLDALTKTWRRLRIGGGPGSPVPIEYEVRLRKRYSADEVRERLRRDGQPFVVGAELEPVAPAGTAQRTMTEE